jgi:hypothetical protein
MIHWRIVRTPSTHIYVIITIALYDQYRPSYVLFPDCIVTYYAPSICIDRNVNN